MPDRIGQQIGNYRLVRLLGSGGFADVYLGQHVHIRNLQAAIKMLHTRLPQNYQEGFLQEAEIIAGLRHPHIIRILDFGIESEDNAPYLIMEYAPYGTLLSRHPKGSIVPPGTVVSYVKQIASPLQYAHDHNRIHRDLKPENLLVGENNEIVLSDFGIAAIARSTASLEKGAYAGTIPYSAPEQILGKPRRESDQYSLGIIVYEWLTGDRPFTGTWPEIISQHLGVLPRPLHEKVPGVPPAVEAVIMKALAKDPHQRFESMRAFANALEQAYIPPPHEVLPVMGHVPRQNVAVTYYPPGITTTIRERIRTWGLVSPQGKILIGLILLLVVLLSVFGGVGVYNTHISQVNADATATSTAQMTATAKPSVTATATQTPQDIYNQTTSGTPVLDDSLSTNATNSWAETNDNNGACLFTAGAYHAIIRPAFSGGIGCFYNSTHFSNLAYQVEMTIIKGGGGGGLLFRNGSGPDPNGWGYQFGLLQDHVGLWYTATTFSSSRAIKAKLNQTYLLTAIARGNTINVYLDKQWVGSAEDNTASSGSIGLAVYGQANFTEVAFRNVKVWKLP